MLIIYPQSVAEISEGLGSWGLKPVKSFQSLCNMPQIGSRLFISQPYGSYIEACRNDFISKILFMEILKFCNLLSKV